MSSEGLEYCTVPASSWPKWRGAIAKGSALQHWGREEEQERGEEGGQEGMGVTATVPEAIAGGGAGGGGAGGGGSFCGSCPKYRLLIFSGCVLVHLNQLLNWWKLPVLWVNTFLSTLSVPFPPEETSPRAHSSPLPYKLAIKRLPLALRTCISLTPSQGRTSIC